MKTIPIFKPTPHAYQNDVFGKLGIPSRGADLYRAIEVGIPYTAFTKLARLLSLDEKELADAMGIAPTTFRRRVRLCRFNTVESDRIYRLALIFKAGCDLFEGDCEAARRWLTRPVKGLGDQRPIDIAATSAQTADVLDLIGRLEHGIAA